MSEHTHLLPAERLERIREALLPEGSVRVAELASLLQVSDVTVRADLSQLEREGLLKRTHGGAVLVRRTRFERPFAEQQTQRVVEKRRIGQAAAELIEDEDTIILDVGTTTTEIARHMPAVNNVVVVTNGLNIASELEHCPGVTVVVTGGTLRPMQHSLVNPYATLLLSQINADKLFLGCNGVSLEKGITNSNLQEAEIKKAMVSAAKFVVAVADSSKIGAVSAAHVCTLADVDALITNSDADPDGLRRLREAGLNVIVV
jgi:DeoR family fructose operon transcriptional repressor